MSAPKRHHYVPRFYLERFTDEEGMLWVFDKHADRVFPTGPASIATECGFYEAPELRGTETDVLFLESQFSALEAEVAKITSCWLQQIERGDSISIPDVNRDNIALYIATQLLRTAEQREILGQFVRARDLYDGPGEQFGDELKNLHARLLCGDFVQRIVAVIKSFIWVFARNASTECFYTSDHPVVLKTRDHTRWLVTPRLFDEGVQLIFPLSPSVILYCKEPGYWRKLVPFRDRVSPVPFTADMARHENSGQVGMSKRFVFSDRNDFTFAREFCGQHPKIRDTRRARFETVDHGPPNNRLQPTAARSILSRRC